MANISKRVPREVEETETIPKIYRFSELIGKTDEILLKSNLLFIDNSKLFFDNIDFFIKLLKLWKEVEINSTDYEILKLIDSINNGKKTMILGLVDDFCNYDRSYIDVSSFKNSTLIIPITYLLWEPKLVNKTNVSCYNISALNSPYSPYGFRTINNDDIEKIKEIIKEVSSEISNCSELERNIIISNYIQRKVQYVDENNISCCGSKQYITNSKGVVVDYNNIYSGTNILFNNFGVCEGIAHATTLLSNNPTINCNVRSVQGSGHAWNVVNIDGNYYFIDNTWNITGNGDKYFESLKARSFCSKYILFGKSSALNMGSHILENCNCPNISDVDFSQEEINRAKKTLSKRIDFKNYDKPVFESHII